MNAEAVRRIKSVAVQEMTHMYLASKLLNALGGTPVLSPPTYIAARGCLLGLALLSSGVAFPAAGRADDPVNATYGVHNPPEVSKCDPKDCIYKRSKDEPTDPAYPPYWTSNWTMYTVFQHYAEFPPP